MGWKSWNEDRADTSEAITDNTLTEMNNLSSEVGQMSEDTDSDSQ